VFNKSDIIVALSTTHTSSSLELVRGFSRIEYQARAGNIPHHVHKPVLSTKDMADLIDHNEKNIKTIFHSN
jgi:hypothetical protein